MPPTLGAYGLFLLAGVGVSTLIAVAVLRHRHEPGARYVLVFALAAVVWTGGETMAALSTSIGAKALWFRFLFLGVIATHPAWFLFVLVYSGRWDLISRRVVAAVWAVPVATAGLTVTNQFHGLVIASVFPIETGAGFDFVPGPVFYVWAAVAGAFLLASVVLLLDTGYRAPDFYRPQVGLLVLGAVAPAAGSLVRVVGVVGVDLTPVGLVLAGAALAMAVSRTDFLVVTPVARDNVVERIDAAVLVVDRRDRLVDANRRAEELLGPERDVVGAPMEDVLEPYPGAHETYRELIDDDVEEIELPIGEGHYRVLVTRLTDHRGRLLGRAFLVSDISERVGRERELARQNERLEEFAELVSHDLRNPISIADGYLELAREEGDEAHFDRVADAIDRMDTIVDDVLTLAREGRRVPEAGRTPTSLRDVAESAWSTVPAEGGRLVVEGDAEILADVDRLRRALENLLSNAVEHGRGATGSRGERADSGESTGEGGAFVRGGEAAAVTVRVGPIDGDGLAGFYVEDDGPGIPEPDREAVFESGVTTDEESTGLGLAIVREIVEAHGWTVEVTAGESGGARFEVTGVEPA